MPTPGALQRRRRHLVCVDATPIENAAREKEAVNTRAADGADGAGLKEQEIEGPALHSSPHCDDVRNKAHLKKNQQ